jgi:hypothetical protein
MNAQTRTLWQEQQPVPQRHRPAQRELDQPASPAFALHDERRRRGRGGAEAAAGEPVAAAGVAAGELQREAGVLDDRARPEVPTDLGLHRGPHEQQLAVQPSPRRCPVPVVAANIETSPAGRIASASHSTSRHAQLAGVGEHALREVLPVRVRGVHEPGQLGGGVGPDGRVVVEVQHPTVLVTEGERVVVRACLEPRAVGVS